ncbi:MAG: (NiFe) hydrogenase maturation protein HypF [Solirubrobacterales bacterium]|nr:(NiFe) hydrogenase maturation protein HypF [Solirubrobacterales bacterium]
MSTHAPPAAIRRVRVRVEGTVQGVGFRPFVYRLAGELELAGYVLNDTCGVLVELEGEPAALAEFLDRLSPDAPALARIERVAVAAREPTGAAGFAILASPPGGVAQTPVTPDSATCGECLRELFDPADRRHRYAFINCTNCGPRFTIVRGVPYDRALTTMAGFRMCAHCQAEYDDPADRRFHAQPNACPDCGPSLSLMLTAGSPAPLGARDDAIGAAAEALRDGRILAVKGIGGFHLACHAENERAVATLRARKHREDKPFALMVADVGSASEIVRIGEPEERLLCGAERPIVLAPRLPGTAIAPSVAPRAPELGVMLPYAPLQHLLFAELEQRTALVMTSGNVSDEPIAFRDDDATHRLSSIADLLLVHDRPIQTRTDDSVVRTIDRPHGRRTVTLRRSRGYVPAALALPEECPRAVLALGAELKSTFCLARGGRAWVSHHIGDLENYETLRSFTDGIGHFKQILAVEPEVVAHDLHPEYLSSKYAEECGVEELIGVQHHHAHLAACLAEHGETGPALGAIFDGTGYGPDGTIWGGELLLGDLGGFRRVGALLPVAMPGGARAITEPWRMACAWLTALAARDGREAPPEIPVTLRDAIAQRSWQQVAGLARSGVSSPATTSVGRLFDAVAALCGIRPRVSYEGQAAIELEAACDPAERGRLPCAVRDGDGMITLDPRDTIEAVSAAVAAGEPAGVIASRFHAAICHATVEALRSAAASESCGTVVLAGGVFQNRRLLETAIVGLERSGLRVLVPERLPIGDGGISFGQAAVASRRIAETPGGP